MSLAPQRKFRIASTILIMLSHFDIFDFAQSET